MTQPNEMTPMKTVHALFDTFKRERALEPVLALFHPDVEWHDSVVTNTTLRGRRGFTDAMAKLESEGYQTESEPEGYEDLGNGVIIARGFTRLVREDSYTDLPAFWAFKIRDGQIVRGATATRRSDALEAVRRAAPSA